MKHIQSINEWFGNKLTDKLKDYKFFGNDFIVKKKSEMDIFLQNIAKIIKNENIEIIRNRETTGPLSIRIDYSIIIDEKKYVFSADWNNKYYFHVYNNKNLEEEIEIVKNDFQYIEKLYQEQENKKYSIEQATKKKEAEDKIRKLPNLSDEGRAARKYNI